MFDQRFPSSAGPGAMSPGADSRAMKIGPLDLRQQRFKTRFRGFDQGDVIAFLTEAADDYEQALRELDRLRQEVARLEALLAEHRERETNVRNTLLTAQRVADELKENAQNEAKLVVREAEGRAKLTLEKAQNQLDEIERGVNEMRLRRRSVEASLEASIQALYHALEFVREQDRGDSDERAALYRNRQAGASEPSTADETAPEERRSSGT